METEALRSVSARQNPGSSRNNREVTIARLAAEDECYLAIFTKEGVTFTIQTKNLTEEELLMVLRELC